MPSEGSAKGVRCMVLGGTGFLGLNLCRALVANGASVRSLSRRPLLEHDHVAEWQHAVDWIKGDFSDAVFVNHWLRNIDVVFHLISTTLPAASNEDIQFDIVSNVLPTVSMLKGAKAAGVAKVVFISSGGTVYGKPKRVPISEDDGGDPICAYGIHKLAIEKYLHLFYHLDGLEYTVLRVANPYGIGQPINRPQGVIASFVNKVANHETLEVWGNGAVVRDYIHIDDVVEACVRVLGHKGPSRLFNIGSGCGHSVLDVISMIRTVVGGGVQVRFREGRPADVEINVLDIRRAMAELNWAPKTDLQTGIKQMLAHALGGHSGCVSSRKCIPVFRELAVGA